MRNVMTYLIESIKASISEVQWRRWKKLEWEKKIKEESNVNDVENLT